MEVYEFKDRHLLLKILRQLWEQDKDAFFEFKNKLIIIPTSELEKSGLTVLPGSAEQFIVEGANKQGLLEGEEGSK